MNEKSELHDLSPNVKNSLCVKDILLNCTLARVDGQEKQMGFDNFFSGNAIRFLWGWENRLRLDK